MDDMPASMMQWYRRRIADLETRLGKQAKDLHYTQRMLGYFREQADLDRWMANRPPGELVHALRSHTVGPFQPVWVTVGDRPLLVLVDGAGSGPDEGAELTAWEWLQTHARPRLPGRGIARTPMPAHIQGIAYPDQAIIISSGLCGQLARQAWRTLRDSLHRQARAPGLRAVVLLPLLAAFRTARCLLSPAMGTATTATAVMPLMTAAAISYGSVSGTVLIPGMAVPGHGHRVAQMRAVFDPLPVPGSWPQAGRPGDRRDEHDPADDGDAPQQAPPIPSAPAEPPAEPTAAPAPSTPTPSPSPSPEGTPTATATPQPEAPEVRAAPDASPTPQPSGPEPTPAPAGDSPAPADPAPADPAPADPAPADPAPADPAPADPAPADPAPADPAPADPAPESEPDAPPLAPEPVDPPELKARPDDTEPATPLIQAGTGPAA